MVKNRVYRNPIASKVLVIATNHSLAVKRNKLFNTKREVVLRSIAPYFKMPMTLMVRLSGITKWLPDVRM